MQQAYMLRYSIRFPQESGAEGTDNSSESDQLNRMGVTNSQYFLAKGYLSLRREGILLNVSLL